MIFFLGIGFLVVGLVMIFIFLRTVLQPKTEAKVLKVTEEYPKTNEFAPQRKLPFGLIDYYYDNTKYEQKIMLKGKKIREGDTIKISVKKNDPSKATHYYPVKEISAIIIVNLLGAALVLVSLYFIKIMD
jgi:hypothetical protein